MKIVTWPTWPTLYLVHIAWHFSIEFDSKHQRLICFMNPSYPSAFGAEVAHIITAWLRGKRGDQQWTIDDVIAAAEELEAMP